MATNSVAAPDFSRKSIRALLKAYPDAGKLARHPLAALSAIASRQDARPFVDDELSRGVALRRLIEAAVGTLKPDDGVPDYAQPRWRAYAILHDQFLQKS